MYEVIIYYKYTPIEDTEKLANAQRSLCERLGIKGRIIIAQEGINGTCEGTKEAIAKYCREFTADPRFVDVWFKKSPGTGNAFPKLKVKVRSEIVSAHLGEEDVDPNTLTGKHITPEELQSWYESGEDFVVVDMRNDYEYRSGHFEGSLNPEMMNFRDLPKAEEKLREELRDKKVLTVCTYGVRCEKASGYLLKKGWKNVHQLEGGIGSYMKKYPASMFRGSLYVFDNRLVEHFDPEDKHEIVGKCLHCGEPSESYVNCKNLGCHYHFICCANCRTDDGEAFCGGDECKNLRAVEKVREVS